MIRVAFTLLALLLLAGCFSPKFPECSLRCGNGCPEGLTCANDGFCHASGETRNCAVPGGVDAALAVDASFTEDATPGGEDAAIVSDASLPLGDARIIDARIVDARIVDASLLPDATRPDTGVADARVDAAVVDASPDANRPDARDCGGTCADPRTCGSVDGCECGSCQDADWCGDFCAFAVCESTSCCLPESTPCDAGLGQCCAGLVCLTFCAAI